MKVSLTPEQEKFVLDQIKNGRAQSAEEVVGCGLEFLRAHDEFVDKNLEHLRQEIDIGIQQADRGELIDGEQFFENLLAKIRDRKGGGQ